MIFFVCPNCKKKLQVADEHAGKTIACPSCNSRATAPSQEEPIAEAALIEPGEPRRERIPKRRRDRDDYDDDDDLDDVRKGRPAAAYPSIVGMAAGAWIGFGCLILLSGGANVILQLALGANGPRDPGAAAGQIGGNICGLAIVLIFGIAFIHVGVQTLRGVAPDTLGNGIGSLIFGLLNLGCGGAVFFFAGVAGAAVGGAVAVFAFIGAIINLIAGFGLIAAGAMALVGRQPYLDWQSAQRRRR
jgi:hypothetical protein